MPRPANDGQLAADSIGTGSVQVSPLDMALAAALVDSGSWHRPSLVTSPPDPAVSLRVPATSARVVGVLQTLMRQAVAAGAGKAAASAGAPVYGQVGNVSLGPGLHGLRASWFVGYRGNMAFAVLELTRSAGTSAAPVAGRFLDGLSRGP